jgi:hypothetical protein
MVMRLQMSPACAAMHVQQGNDTVRLQVAKALSLVT